MASLLIGPTDRWPDVTRQEWQYAHIIGAQTAVLVAHGGGMVHTVACGVAGTLAKFYDTPTGGTADATTQIATVDLAAATRETQTLDVAFSKGLTVIITGGATTDIVISFIGAPVVSSKTFGTQLDGGDSRALGTSIDKAMAS